MKLSIIILNYNVEHFLELCLKSVEDAIEFIDAEVIVVDNNSQDNSCAMVKRLFPHFKLIENKENSGFSKGNNIGVAQAQGKYICILNPDTVVAEDTFLKLIAFAETKTNLGIIGCQLIDGSGKYLPESKRNIPSPSVSLKKILGNNKDYYANHINKNLIEEVEILVGAFMFLKKVVYDHVGGFDEDYFMYGEDIDLSYSVLKANFHNFYFGSTTVIHFKGESTLKDSNYAKRFYGAMEIFYKKHFKRSSLFNLLVWIGIKMVYVFRSSTKPEMLVFRNTVLYSSQIEETIKKILPKPIAIETKLSNSINDNSLIVYDCKLLKIKTIIGDMKKKSKQENIGFRFIPKNSKFIVGSDSATARGEIAHF